MSSYQKNIEYFRKREPNFLINVIIGNQEYELQVTKKHKISAIINRYTENGFMNVRQGDQVIAMMSNTKLDANQTIEDLQNKIGQANGKQQEITIELVKVDPQIEKKQAGQLRNENQMPKKTNNNSQDNKESDKKMVEYLYQLSVKSFSIDSRDGRKQSTISPKQLQYLLAALENKSSSNIQQQYKQFCDVLMKKVSTPKFSNVISMLKQINIGKKEIIFEDLPNLSPEERQIQKMLQTIKVSLTSYFMTKSFVVELEEKLKVASSQFNILPSKKSRIENANYGKVEQEILELSNKFIETIRENKKNQQQTRQQNQTKQKLLQRQLDSCMEKIKILKQEVDSLRNKAMESSRISQSYEQKNKNMNIVMTNYLNRKVYSNEVTYLMQSIQKYEKASIKQFESILSVKKGQMPFQVILSFLQSLTAKNSRVLILLGTQQGNFMGFYSTIGVNKLDMKSPAKKGKVQSDRSSQISKSGQGPGFFIEINNKKVYLSANNQTEFISYDQKFLYLGCCFQIMGSVKKKLQIEFKQMKRKQLKDNEDELKTIFTKKKVQITHLEILRIFLNKSQLMKKGEATVSMQSTNMTFNNSV